MVSDVQSQIVATDGSTSEKTEVEVVILHPAQNTKDSRFWMVFVATLTVDMLSALDLSAVSTALPTIVDALHGDDFVWAGGAYAIASTAIVPLIGGLVSTFGRRSTLVACILFIAAGSAITRGAQNMSMLIAGRAIQGFGGGGCLATTQIIMNDLIPLPEIGKYQGIFSGVWALACAIGPPIGGALADAGAWRWLFFLNLPVCGIALTLVFFFLRVRTPKSSFREKILGLDWVGNPLIIGSAVSVLVALTFGGFTFPWASGHVLAPLVIGGVGLVLFFLLEFFWVKHPMVPSFFFTNRTILSGYLGTFFHGVVTMVTIYYLPVYFQGSKGVSAIGCGVDLLGLSFVIPFFAIVAGVSVMVFNRYRPQNYVGWVLILVGFVVLSFLDEHSSRARYIASQLPVAAGLGMAWNGPQFAVLAPLPYSNNANALAFFIFVRCFAQSWGTIIGGAILQNKLQETLPAQLIDNIPHGAQLAYSIIPTISSLSPDLQSAVRTSFANSVRLIWLVMIGFSGAGLLTCLMMKEVPIRTAVDESWGLTEEVKPTGEDLEHAM